MLVDCRGLTVVATNPFKSNSDVWAQPTQAYLCNAEKLLCLSPCHLKLLLYFFQRVADVDANAPAPTRGFEHDRQTNRLGSFKSLLHRSQDPCHTG